MENLENSGSELSNEEMLSMLGVPDSQLRQLIEGKTSTQLNLELKEAKKLEGLPLENEEAAKVWYYWSRKTANVVVAACMC